MTVDPAAFRDAMARFASGVTIVTARNESGAPWGFTASAFSSLSLEPPLVLVCLDKRADSHPVFASADYFAVSILTEGQDGLALKFATRGADKFGDLEVITGPATGLPLIPGALSHLECRIHDRLPGGDHTILVGEVLTASGNDQPPLLHYNRTFGRFQPVT